MKEAIVNPDTTVRLIDVPVPTPGHDQVLIKVVYAGSNPKDWKSPAVSKKSFNSGDDVAGIVEAVGEDVTRFKPGDKVAAFHQMLTPNGAFAEYAVAPSWTTFHLPEAVSYEEAATIPLAAFTSAIGLFMRMGLPPPWQAATNPIPLIVYGAAGAVGSFAIKLAQLSNIHPIIAIAGNGIKYVETIIDRSRGDSIVDYRSGDENIVDGIKKALREAGTPDVSYAYDGVSEHNSFQNLSQVLSPGGHITMIRIEEDYSPIPDSLNKSLTFVGILHDDVQQDKWAKEREVRGGKEFGEVWSEFFETALKDGSLKGHPFEAAPGGLGGIQKSLSKLKAGKVSAVKFIFKISDTEGISSS